MANVQAVAAAADNTWKTYMYNPSLWLMVLILASMVEYTTRCGDSYR